MAPQQATTFPSLSHSDVHSLLSIITMRLGERNFIKWSFQFQSTLAGNGLFGFYDGSEVAPPRYALTTDAGVTNEETTAYKAWKQTDMALLSLLMATLDEDIVNVIIGYKTSRQAWLALHERFSTVSRVNIMQLKTELRTLRKGAETIEKYLQRVKNARDQLLSVGVTIPDEDIIIVILNGLPDEYSTVRTVIEGRENPVTLRDLRSQLLVAERRIEGSFSLQSSMSAMVAQGDGPGAGQRDGNKRGWASKGDSKGKDGKYTGTAVGCQVCGKRGHTMETCFHVHKCQICGKHGNLTSTCYQNLEYKPQSSQPQHRSSLNIGPSPECQICSKKGHTATNCFYRTDVPDGHPSLSIPTCQICGLKGHVALNCTHITNFAYQGSDPPTSLIALSATQTIGSANNVGQHSQGGYSISHGSFGSSFPGGFNPSSGASSSSAGYSYNSSNVPQPEVWIGDSGVTHHMTSELRNLTIAQPYSYDNKITIGNGTGQGIQNSSLPRKE
ncbi:PREDICTED: uncharacterized protein LOC101292509 [Fragaria vesca subsp. vesca]